MDIRDIGLRNCCDHYIRDFKKRNRVYFQLKHRFITLINYFFYRKLRQDVVPENVILNRWYKNIPENLINRKETLTFVNLLRTVVKQYNKNMNIKCIANPIDIKLHAVKITGQIDVVTKNENKYSIHYLTYSDSYKDTAFLNKVIPGILGISFYSDFRLKDFNIVMHDVTQNRKKIIQVTKDNIFPLKDTSFIKIEELSNNCRYCSLRGKCSMKKSEISLSVINECFKKIIMNLSVLEIMICYLKLDKGLTYKEISDILCISHESVRQYLHGVYKVLKEEIENEKLSK